MAELMVATMVIKVDLQCPSCYKKIKKLLFKFPEIRDQIYDEKQNTVTITVVSYCPERIRDKLCCKGGKIIKSIEIKPPPKPKESENKPKESEKKPKESEKKPKEPEKKPKEPENKLTDTEKPNQHEKKPREEVRCPTAPPEWTPFYPWGRPCYGPCCNWYGYGGGPCQAYGRPVPWYDNYGYGPYGYCGNTGPYVSRREYCCEENSSACTIM